jgi:uncharacterized coiled-coil protein SlyX
MEDRMQERLAELRRELAQGEQLLAELSTREVELRTSMLRIAGAIQVLDELLAADGSPGADAPPEATTTSTDPREAPVRVSTARVPVG